jgi:NAD(P)-dependent dehydrogenase (short-subunit alcohol dehydrogenase family)
MTSTSDYYADKVAVVTGAASGIGLALAETMLSYGAKKVVLADFNAEKLSGETARVDKAYPGKARALHCDVTNESEVEVMIHDAAEFGGRIDFLFNNAGSGFGGIFDDLTNRHWEKAFAVNFYGALYGIRAVLPIMRRQGGGHIVDIVSGIAFAPMAQMTQYSATKAALTALTLALRYELWDENIRVSAATPGVTATGIWKASGVPTPPRAQPADQSARTILAGVAKNERLVLGDQDDAFGAKVCFNPEAAASVDDYLLKVARKRRRGELVV